MASLVLSGCIANFFSSGKVAKQSKAGAGVLRLENLPYPLRPGEVLEGDYVPPTTPTDTTVSSGPTEATLSSEPFGPPPASETEVAVLETKFGKIIIELNDRMAPIHSENFRKNCRTGFYTETTFHRVVPGFLIQGGDINSKDDDRNNDGFGYPGYTLPLEKKLKHVRGAVGAGRKMDKVNPERRSDGTQFYICLADAPFLDGKYTVFGRVVAGMNVVDRITQVPRDERDNPIHRIEMRATLMKYREAMANP
ncbi:MAG: peptidylprolyl isomerase [Verrucomicrobiae bacterium]|nr:peptidylprolyl isomerase [Verrucomicrobiae bacterium]